MLVWYRTLIASLLLGTLVVPCPHAAEVAQQLLVREELERLEQVYRFEVRGIEQTDGAKGWAEGENPLKRLTGLLEGFDHIILQAPDGGIERVIILGEKTAYVPPPEVSSGAAPGAAGSGADSQEAPIVVPMHRSGSSHAITASLEGANGTRLEQVLVIDTGAERVVLPASLVAGLGLATDSLANQQVQTANGIVTARVGRLPAVWLGQQRVPDVEVAFIDDQSLGGNALLGMSLLGRYRMTLDDRAGHLTLASKDQAPASEPPTDSEPSK